ncbi:MAG: SAF domain-containing protein [Propionibacteriaceae bacterium]|nr:SAF domain-containing protein [Propionibacteriaceae bacterium]
MSISWLPASQPLPQRKSVSLLAAIVVLVACLGGLGTAYGFAQISHGQPVIVVAKPVLQGNIIQSGDLGVAEISAPGVPAVPLASQGLVVGSRALHTLNAGSLLAADDFGQPTLPPSTALVALRLGPGQVPSASLPGGCHVLLLGLPGLEDADEVVLAFSAWVVYPPQPQLDGTVVMSVAVSVGDVNALTPYLLHQRVTVVIDGRG